MSFLGSIGHLMSGSGLNELLETVYAPNTIPYMISGKAISRAVRGHILVSNALNVLLMRQHFSTYVDKVETTEGTQVHHDSFLSFKDAEKNSDKFVIHVTERQLDEASVARIADTGRRHDVDNSKIDIEIETLEDTGIQKEDVMITHKDPCITEIQCLEMETYTGTFHDNLTTHPLNFNTEVQCDDEVRTRENKEKNHDNPYHEAAETMTQEIIDTESLFTVSNLNGHTEAPHSFKMKDLLQCYKELVSGNISVDTVYQNNSLDYVEREYLKLKKDLKRHPTAALWIQYLEMVDILRLFIASERTGQWKLGLQAMQKMLPYFAAAGHNLYLKSVYLYLQTTQSLYETHPNVHKAFLEGYHVVRRTDRYWAGLSPDLVIEQVLMRSVKSTGGMTRGKGMTESQRTQWLLSMPSCIDINNAMQAFCGKECHTSPQHKEVGWSRTVRDQKDTQTLISYLEERNPFREDALLFNIETGVTSHSSVNAHQADIIGKEVVSSMVGKNAFELAFKRNKKAVTLDVAQQININDEPLKVALNFFFKG